MTRRLLAAIVLLFASFSFYAADNDPLIVHEWGTFTTVQGTDGIQLTWTPSIKTDLPDFVYSRDTGNGGIKGVALLDTGEKSRTPARVRMETPVIYFYSQAERVVDVRVRFPNGRITEWYPQATTVGPFRVAGPAGAPAGAENPSQSMIAWNAVTILSREATDVAAPTLIRDREDKQAVHYYAARETDANFLRVTSPHSRNGSRSEHERDLFYRGVGFFTTPLTVKLDEGEREVTLSTGSAEPLAGVFVLTVQGGSMRYQKIERVTAHAGMVVDLNAQSFEPLADARKRIMDDVAASLVDSGLYAREARAMIETWKDQWFAEEGTRVLYLLPRSWTDETLPLEISPRPDNIVRVMVGRAEVITPSLERALQKQIVAFGSSDPATRQRAAADARRLGGRFAAPAVQRIVERNPDAMFQQHAWELLALAGAPAAPGT
jgi:hypothetical protein